MILTGNEIDAQVANGSIVIEPYSRQHLNPNSYNYRLSSQFRVYTGDVVDALKKNQYKTFTIPSRGQVLVPGVTYLATTIETIGSREYVPSLIGRSSLGRLGLYLQIAADRGNLGAIHRWTLEMVAVQPIRVYPGMLIGQVSFWRTDGARSEATMYNNRLGRSSEAEVPMPTDIG